MADHENSKSLLEQAYDIGSAEEAKDLYRQWARSYEEDMLEPLGYIGPWSVAETAERHNGDKDLAVLDVGCGTGLVGANLAERGYHKIDGLDFSAEMLAVAGEKGCYGRLFQADLNKPLDLPDGHYGLLISCGTFTHGHVGPNPFRELMRVCRSGGSFCGTINADIFESDGFARTFQALEDEGVLKIESLDRKPMLLEEGIDGIYAVLRKT